MRLENSELRAFHAVIEEGGFKRAADALHVSQSAVSQAVAGLESKLETTLVQRGKELQLTDVGRRVFAHAADVLQREQRTLEDVAQLKRGRAETLSIALSGSINRFYAPELINAYYHQNPGTRLMIAEMPARSIISAVLSGNVELGFGPFQKDMAAFDTVPLYSDTRHLVVSPRHAHFEALAAGDAGALKRTPLIASALDNPDMRPSIARLRDQFSAVWEVSSLRLRIYMVDEGMGVTFVDGRMLHEHPTCRSFRIMSDIPFGQIDKQVGIYYRSGRALSDSAEKFIDLCQDHWLREISPV